MKDRFKGKQVYIVGGSSGIGLAAGELMAAAGAHVLIFARREAVLKDASARISSHRKQEEQRVGYFSLDVSQVEHVQAVIQQAVADFGIPDILINSAGRAQPGYFEAIGYQQFDETMRINLYGIRNTIAALLPYMKTKGGGQIVNVASIAGFLGLFGYTDYCASKFALIGFSEALRSEVRTHGISVSVLCPPDTDTPGYAQENVGKPPETRALSESAKLMSAEDVARSMLKGMLKKQFMIIPGLDGRLIFFAKRWLPGLVEAIMDASIRKVQKQRKEKN